MIIQYMIYTYSNIIYYILQIITFTILCDNITYNIKYNIILTTSEPSTETVFGSQRFQLSFVDFNKRLQRRSQDASQYPRKYLRWRALQQ